MVMMLAVMMMMLMMMMMMIMLDSFYIALFSAAFSQINYFSDSSCDYSYCMVLPVSTEHGLRDLQRAYVL